MKTGVVVRLVVLLLALISPQLVLADSGVQYGPLISWSGSHTLAGETLLTADAASGITYHPYCMVMSTTGVVQVLLSLDGTNFSSAALSLQDFGSTDASTVLTTVAGRIYGFVHGALAIKVVQSGDTDSQATMNCWADKSS